MKYFSFIIITVFTLTSFAALAEEPIVEEIVVDKKVVEKAPDKKGEIVETTEESVLLEEKAPVEQKTVDAAKTKEPVEIPASTEKAKEPAKKQAAAVKDKAKKKDELAKEAEAKATEEDQMEVSEGSAGTVEGENVKPVNVNIKIEKNIKVAPAYPRETRDGKFRLGLVGPGIYAGNKGIDAMMGIGVEGEYFFFEKLSAGMRIQMATDFQANSDPNVVTSFVPQARYVFDFDNHPRWSIYVQAGAGVALIESSTIAADIAVPGIGFWWQWNENYSIGLDAVLHVLIRSSQTAVAGFAGPAFRYQF